MIFDTHTHLNAYLRLKVKEKSHRDAKELSVTLCDGQFVNDCVTWAAESSKKWFRLSDGINEAYQYNIEIEEWLGTLDASISGRDGKWVWIIIGKDSTPEEQDKDPSQITVAKEMKLPIVILCDATEDCYKILKEEGIQDIRGSMHSYNGDGIYEAFLE